MLALVLATVAAAVPSEMAVSHASEDGVAAGIAVVRVDGSGLRWLTQPSTRRFDGEPAWAPDANRVVFTRTTDDWRTFHLWVVPASGGRARKLTSGVYDEAATWSPDGRRIAFRSLPRHVTRGCTRGGIFVLRPAGGRPRLVPGTNGAGGPSWSPDGRLLAYEKDGWLWSSRPDGTHRSRLRRGTAPAWSPDGKRLAFVTRSGVRGEVAVLTLGGGVRTLTDDRFMEDNPAWSADGRVLAYDSARGSDHATYVLELATGRERRVLSAANAPAWRP